MSTTTTQPGILNLKHDLFPKPAHQDLEEGCLNHLNVKNMKNESTSPQIFRERERDGAVIHAGCSFCLLSMHGEGGDGGGRRGGGEGWEGVMVADTSVPPLPPPETERPTFNHQTHCYIKPPAPHKPGLLPVARQQAPEPHRRVSLGRGCT